MSLSSQRMDALRQFAATHFGGEQPRIESASADASFRSYWRVYCGSQTALVMDAPPDKEDLAPWIDIAQRLRDAGLNAPQVLAQDRAQGFLLISDLGTRLYLPALDATSVDGLYKDALDAAAQMQGQVRIDNLPEYNRERLVAEMELLPTWFLGRHLGLHPGCAGWDLIEAAFGFLATAALEQPRRFVHRDYHSRNLLIAPGANPGIIDFQDAVSGPLTYDPVSLLRDCYIQWPRERVLAWSEAHRCRLSQLGITDADAATWKRWFDLMGLQRHLKVLGIFCRLCYRDHKAGYLNDLPLVLRYTLEVADEYPQLHAFAGWLRAAVGNRDLTRPHDPAAGPAVQSEIPDP